MTARGSLRTLVTAFAALASITFVAAVPAGTAQAAPATSASAPTIDVTFQTPWVEPKGTFLLQATVSGATAGSQLEATLHTQRLADRSAFSLSLFGLGLSDRSVRVPAVDIAGHGAARTSVSLAIALKQGPTGPGVLSLRRGLSGPGVYAIELALVDADGKLETRVVTDLVRLGDGSKTVEPLRTAMVFSLHAPPTVAPDGTTTIGARTFDDVSALADVLDAHPKIPVTLDPTPETIEALQRTSAATQATLATLEGALDGRQVLDAPYVDIPFTAWVNAGMGDELTAERERGHEVLNKLLGPPDSTTWVAAPDLTTLAATRLWDAGIRQVVLPASTLDPSDAASGDATAARPFEISTPAASPLDAVGVDSALSGLAFGPQPDPQLTAYRVLAELAMVEAEDPTSVRGVVLAAPTDWTPSAPFLDTLFDGLADDPLAKPVTVAQLFSSVAPERTGTDDTGPVAVRGLHPFPSAGLGTYPQALDALQDAIVSYRAMVGTDPTLQAQWDQRILISGSADLGSRRRDAYLRAIHRVITGEQAGIDAPQHQTVTLTARQGNIPLTLRSRLKRSVKVELTLDSNPRLEFPHGNRVRVTLQPGTQQIELTVRARSPGDTPLTVRVLSPDGGLPLTATRITVRSTAVSGIGYVLSVGAALFLLVWWARHWRRDRRTRKAAAAGAPDDTDAPVPSDPQPVT